MNSRRSSGPARLYLDAPPVRGAHPGYRGPMVIDACGVHIGLGSEWLAVDNEHPTEEWPMGEWEGVHNATVVPWHRVYALDWQDE